MDITEYKWRCGCCGKEMSGLPMDFACQKPKNWFEVSWFERLFSYRHSDFFSFRVDGNKERYIRCVLPVPVPEIEGEFRFGVWMSVSKQGWRDYRDGYNSGVYGVDGCFGYLGNAIPGQSGSFGLHADIAFQAGDQRPIVKLHDTDHPLVDLQRTGMTVGQIEELASTMHGR